MWINYRVNYSIFYTLFLLLTKILRSFTLKLLAPVYKTLVNRQIKKLIII